MSPHPHRALSGPSDNSNERVERVGKETSGEVTRSTRLTEQQFWALADIPAEAECVNERGELTHLRAPRFDPPGRHVGWVWGRLGHVPASLSVLFWLDRERLG